MKWNTDRVPGYKKKLVERQIRGTWALGQDEGPFAPGPLPSPGELRLRECKACARLGHTGPFVCPPSRKTSLFYPLSPKSSGRHSEPTLARGYDLCSQSSLSRDIAIGSKDPIQVYRGQSLLQGLGQKSREWAGVTSVVPACCQPFEEVMSLNTIWLDTGMSGLCGLQTGGE